MDEREIMRIADHFTFTWDADVVAFARAIERQARAALAATQAEPIYQFRMKGQVRWLDMTKDEFDARQNSLYEKRIVYAAPVLETATQASQDAFVIKALVAAGHVTQQKVDEAYSIAGRYAAPESSEKEAK